MDVNGMMVFFSVSKNRRELKQTGKYKKRGCPLTDTLLLMKIIHMMMGLIPAWILIHFFI